MIFPDLLGYFIMGHANLLIFIGIMNFGRTFRPGIKSAHIHRRGHFVDVKTIGAALLGASLGLKKLADKLEVAHRKLDEDQHGGLVTPAYRSQSDLDE
jgi:hypothetical protein